MSDAPSLPVPPPVCGIVVSFHPDAEVPANLAAVAAQCAAVVVVDNGSSAEARAGLAAVPGVTLVPLGENLGVAVALNRGAARARELGCEWAVLFDQDSRPEPGMIAALWAAHLRHPAVGIVGPCVWEEGGNAERYRWVRPHPRWPGCFQRVACTGTDLTGVTMLITSGSLIDLGLWRQLGGFIDGLFIDYVDVDYCLGVRAAGRDIVVAAAARLRHRLGARREARLLGRDFRPMHHAAFRHYYMARNRIFVWRRFARRFPHWALFDLGFAGFNLLRVLLFEDRKFAKLRAMTRGAWDGLRGRAGPMPERVAETLR